jgi:hypothetical protein
MASVKLVGVTTFALAASFSSAAWASRIPSDTPYVVIPDNICTLGAGPCSASSLGLGGPPSNLDTEFLGNVYIYDSGIISLNGPLPSGANLSNRATLGSSFLAPGLITSGAYNVSAYFPGPCVYNPYACGTDTINSITILFSTGNTLFGATITDNNPAGANTLSNITVSFSYGASADFPDGSGNFPSPTLPAGAQIGYNVGGARFWETAPHDPGATDIGGAFDASTPGPPFTPTGVPEPQAWALMLAGLGLVGAGFRRQWKAHANA